MGSLSPDGALWALNGGGESLRFLGDNLQQKEASQLLTSIAVANASTIYGLDAAGNVYQIVDGPFTPAPWPGLWHVSVAPDGTTWGLDGHGNIFSWTNGAWLQQPNGGAHLLFVAVGNATNIWTITSTLGFWGGPGQALKWNGSAFVAPAGAPADAMWIAIAPDDQSVYIQTKSNTTLKYVNGSFVTIATNTPLLFGLAAGVNGLLFAWNFLALCVLSGGGWFTYGGPTGNCGYAGVAADGTLLMSGKDTQRMAGFNVWTTIPVPDSGRVDAIPINDHKMFFKTWAGGYVQWSGSRWQQIAGTNFKSISAGSDGTLWGVDKSNKIYSFNGSSWQSQPGTMQKVSVGSAGYIVGLDPSGKIFYWNNGTWTSMSSPGTTALIDVSIGADSAMFAIDGTNDVWTKVAPGDWTKISNLKLIQVEVADRYHVCGTTSRRATRITSGRDRPWRG
jgi:hypothetical protein